MMEDPIPVDNSGMSADDKIRVMKAKHAQRMSTVILVVAGVAVLSLFVPLGVFLTRLAMGS